MPAAVTSSAIADAFPPELAPNKPFNPLGPRMVHQGKLITKPPFAARSCG
jgi:hypothetical protein